MDNQPRRRRRASQSGILTVLTAGLCSCPALAQGEFGAFRQGRADPYGNARPWYPERRTVGNFANEVQRQALRGHQLEGRRQNRRGVSALFRLSEDPFANPDGRRFRPAPRFGEPSPMTRKIFAQYGGFGRRSRSTQDQDLWSIFGRRHALIEATSRTAPVERALAARSFPAGLPAFAKAVPYAPLQADGTTVSQTPTLGERLRGGVARSYVRIRSDGWESFREGRYRQAARAFESAVLLQPRDLESRIGELFSYVSVGAMRTSVTLLRQLARREANPFGHELNLHDRYGYPVEAREARIRCQLFSQTGDDVTEAAALYAFVLWYMGEHEEAMAAATNLARKRDGTVYTDWVRQMEAAAADRQPGAGEP